MNFGIIKYELNGNAVVIAEGEINELNSLIEEVRDTINSKAEIKLVDKALYMKYKDNILELNKQLNN